MARASKLLLVTAASGIAFRSWALDHTVTEQVARKLVEEAIVALGRSIPASQVQPMTSYWSPQFYNFEAVLGQSSGLPALRFYFAVNPWNGDVWNPIGCTLITSSAIEKEQEAIWKQSNFPQQAREALHYQHPGTCDPPDPPNTPPGKNAPKK